MAGLCKRVDGARSGALFQHAPRTGHDQRRNHGLDHVTDQEGRNESPDVIAGVLADPARIKPKVARAMLGSASSFLTRVERFIRPRQQWIRGRLGQKSLAALIVAMACLMILPIPLTNTLPAMVIFMIGVGLSEEDGLLAIAAFFVGCCALLLYAGIIYLVITQGVDAIEPIKEWIKSAVGLGD